MKHFCVLIVVVFTQSYTWKNWVESHTYIDMHTQVDMQIDRHMSTYKTDEN